LTGSDEVELLLLTTAPDPGSVLPALTLLPHEIRTAAPELPAITDTSPHDIVVIDAINDVTLARTLCGHFDRTPTHVPVIAVLNERGLVALSREWKVDEILLPSCGPAEIDARLRLARARTGAENRPRGALIIGALIIEPSTYTAQLPDRSLDLTYKEFELLKYLAQHAGQVRTRSQLLHAIWGYDFFGDTRTIDVHVRRLRAKLGTGHQQMITTVRNVGYKLVRPA
jgi:DNA-binding response OmpR family regulator